MDISSVTKETRTLIPFPRSKKRGAKVRNGPLALIVQFPGKPTEAELCRKYAYSVSTSDPERLAKLLEKSGFAADKSEHARIREMIAHAKTIWP